MSADGQTFVDNAPETTEPVRDPAGNVVSVTTGGGRFPTVTATRIEVESPGFAAGTPVVGTPAP